MEQIRLLVFVVVITVTALPIPASAWNIPNHMLSGAIAYPVLSQENPETVEKVKAVLQKHPWYANQWQAKLQDAPVANHDMVLFMQAARYAEHTPSAPSFLSIRACRLLPCRRSWLYRPRLLGEPLTKYFAANWRFSILLGRTRLLWPAPLMISSGS